MSTNHEDARGLVTGRARNPVSRGEMVWLSRKRSAADPRLQQAAPMSRGDMVWVSRTSSTDKSASSWISDAAADFSVRLQRSTRRSRSESKQVTSQNREFEASVACCSSERREDRCNPSRGEMVRLSRRGALAASGSEGPARPGRVSRGDLVRLSRTSLADVRLPKLKINVIDTSTQQSHAQPGALISDTRIDLPRPVQTMLELRRAQSQTGVSQRKCAGMESCTRQSSSATSLMRSDSSADSQLCAISSGKESQPSRDGSNGHAAFSHKGNNQLPSLMRSAAAVHRGEIF